uniref:Glutaredoxin-like protein n=1 Tax=Panagrellus redivivus TaxID=6233 RepID=A0A7E4V0F5_PANRE
MKLFPTVSTLVTAPSTIQKLAIRLLGTAPASKTPLRLVTGDHCTLCVHFKKQLDFYLEKSNRIAEFDIAEVDIKSDESLKETFKYDIPVLLSNDKVVLKHRFSSILFERFLPPKPSES